MRREIREVRPGWSEAGVRRLAQPPSSSPAYSRLAWRGMILPTLQARLGTRTLAAQKLIRRGERTATVHITRQRPGRKADGVVGVVEAAHGA